MVNIPNWFINQGGFFLLVLGSLYMLAAYGEALRGSGYRGASTLGSAITIVRNDIKVFLAGLSMLVVGAFGAFNPLNFGAAIEGLTAFIGPVWAIFTTFTLSSLNVATITDFGIVQLLAVALVFGVGAWMLRKVPEENTFTRLVVVGAILIAAYYFLFVIGVFAYI